MKQAQIGFFDESYQHFYFLEYKLKSGALDGVKQVITEVLDNTSTTPTMIAFGKEAWQKFQPNWTPVGLEAFKTLNGLENHSAPSTQGDLWFWVRGGDISHVFDQAMNIQQGLSPYAELQLQQRGFAYHQSMDLIGFEDGTANPKTDALKAQAAQIPVGQVGEGGSFVLTQKWVHNLSAWQQVPVHCQEKVVGRTKIENEELEGDAMPVDSHVSRTDLKVDGVPMKIYRRSAPYGSVTENGLYFLAFACEMLRFTSQLESMYGLAEDKTCDQLLNYSKAVSGGYWFAPSAQDLTELLKLK